MFYDQGHHQSKIQEPMVFKLDQKFIGHLGIVL